ncbi:MAG: ABC transporter permease subunit [Bacteroidales bacterium]|nr:MAG: ABC transporter permease subunit [Bacteroidales bacterium]
MKRIIRIELLKVQSYSTFWILTSLYFLILLSIFFSGKFFLDFLARKGESLGDIIDPSGIPIYDFPDVWHNITYVAGFLKFILAIYVIISITNEINYGTIRQNIMNGLSRWDFLLSKLVLVCFLSIISTLFIIAAGFILGFIYSGNREITDIITYMEFIPAYLLQITAYLIFALFIGLLIKRTGLSMGLLFLYTLIVEPIITFRIKTDWIKGLFPLKAINNLIRFPFKKYALREVQDYIAWDDTLIVSVYIIIFISLMYLILKKRDL